MRASIVENTGAAFTTDDVELDTPQAREVVVEARAAGLCHSDLLIAGADVGQRKPIVLGHEVAGVVVGVGPGARDVSVGDHVVTCLIQYCGDCRSCKKGRVLQCARPSATVRPRSEQPRLSRSGQPITQGFAIGGFAERVLVHENQVHPVPRSLPYPQAALLGCSVITGAGTLVNAARAEPDDTVVIIGAGGVGLNAVSAARSIGAAMIVVVDLVADKLEFARAFGATHLVDASTVDAVDAVKELLPSGADIVCDFVGTAATSSQGLAMLAPGGGLYLVGILDPEASLAYPVYRGVNLRHRVVGVAMGDSDPRRDIPYYADEYLAGRFELDPLVSRTVALDDLGDVAAGEQPLARIVVESSP